MRRAAKVDANHGEIVEAFRSLGMSVLSLAAIGKGCPDLVVGYAGGMRFVEVKDGRKPPSQRRLTEHQEDFNATWRGPASVIVYSVDDALRLGRSWLGEGL